MSNLIGKIGIWIHDTAKALGRLQELQEMGFSYAVVKIADGTGGPHAYQPEAREQLCAEAAHLGMPVVAWAYVFPEHIDDMVKVLAANLPPGCTDLALDAETEWEECKGAAKLADDLCHEFAVATKHRVSLHLSSLYAPQFHPSFPYDAFLSHCASFMPQSYVEGDTPTALVALRTEQQCKPLAAKSLGKALIPTLNTPGMLTALARNGYRSLNVWLFDGVVLPPGAKRPVGEDMGVCGYESAWRTAIAAFKGK